MKQNIFTHLHKTLSCERFYKTLFHYIGESFFFSFQKLVSPLYLPCNFTISSRYKIFHIKGFCKASFFQCEPSHLLLKSFQHIAPAIVMLYHELFVRSPGANMQKEKEKMYVFLGYIGIYRLLAALTHLQFLSSKLIIDNACRSHIWLLMLLEQA